MLDAYYDGVICAARLVKWRNYWQATYVTRIEDISLIGIVKASAVIERRFIGLLFWYLF